MKWAIVLHFQRKLCSSVCRDPHFGIHFSRWPEKHPENWFQRIFGNSRFGDKWNHHDWTASEVVQNKWYSSFSYPGLTNSGLTKQVIGRHEHLCKYIKLLHNIHVVGEVSSMSYGVSVQNTFFLLAEIYHICHHVFAFLREVRGRSEYFTQSPEMWPLSSGPCVTVFLCPEAGFASKLLSEVCVGEVWRRISLCPLKNHNDCAGDLTTMEGCSRVALFSPRHLPKFPRHFLQWGGMETWELWTVGNVHHLLCCCC